MTVELEPMADAVAAASEIAKLVPRLAPMREAFERLNEQHARIAELERTVRAQAAEIARLKGGAP